MKIKLIDYQEDFKIETTGTCEICFGTMGCSNPVFTFQKENKEQVAISKYGIGLKWNLKLVNLLIK